VLWTGLLLAVAIALRLYRLGQNSFWVDEYASLLVARHPWQEIPAAALRGDAFEPPLYFWLLHVALRMFGESEVILRFPSAVSGGVTIPLTVLLLRGLRAAPRTAVLGGALLAFNPLHIWYSQEARPYALLICLGAGSLIALARALRTNGALAWSGFTVLASLTIMTHVIGVFFPLVGWLWILSRHRNPATLRPLLAATLGIMLLTAPFGFQLARAVVQAQSTGSPTRPLTGLEIPYTVFTYLAGYSFGPSVREIQDLGPMAALTAHPVQSLIGALALAALTVMVLQCVRSSGARSLVVLFLLPMLAVWIGAAVTGKAYNIRYTLAGLIGFVGLSAWGIEGLSTRGRRIALTIIPGIFLWADAQWFFDPSYWKEDSRTAVAWIRERLPAGATIAVAPGYQSSVLGYYGRRANADLIFIGLPDTATSVGSPMPDAVLMTRLHHVPHWRSLVRSLSSSTGTPVVNVGGYRFFRAIH
jgi:uncharacterized membrane protein